MKYRYFEVAERLAHKSIYKFRLGCVIVKGNRILGTGFNSTKTHPRSNDEFKTLHAETDALLSCNIGAAKGAVAYVYRITKDGKPAMSKCCESCEKMLKDAGIKRIYYTKEEYPYWDVIKF